MSYAQLYHQCQELQPVISRSEIIPKACKLAGIPSVKVFLDGGMNTVNLRGFFVQANDPNHPFAKQSNGLPVIVLARSLNRCWKRLITIKELMHLFDDAIHMLATGDEFEALLGEFRTAQPDRSLAMDSEIAAVWMAMGLMCPEVIRQDLARKVDRGEMTHSEVAEYLKIPEQYISQLLSPRFKRLISNILQSSQYI